MPYPTITPLPAAPQRASGDPDFSDQVDTFLSALPGFVTETNAAGDWVETAEAAVEADKTAAEAAQAAAEAAQVAAEGAGPLTNYRGAWDSGTTYALAETVKHSGLYWISNTGSNLNNTPGTDPEWDRVYPKPALEHAIKTDTASTTSTTWVDTGLAVTITLTAPGSTVRLAAHVNASVASGSNVSGHFRLLRGAALVAEGDAAGNRTPVLFSAAKPSGSLEMTSAGIELIDAPGSAGPHTYKLQWSLLSGSATLFLNRSTDDSDVSAAPRGVSTLIAQEILP